MLFIGFFLFEWGSGLMLVICSFLLGFFFFFLESLTKDDRNPTSKHRKVTSQEPQKHLRDHVNINETTQTQTSPNLAKNDGVGGGIYDVDGGGAINSWWW